MRVGLFGGTFDPIHNAHLRMARAAAEEARLERIHIVPSKTPPHREAAASYEDRYRMVEIACASDPLFEASRLEDREGKSYTVETVERFRAGHPDDPAPVFIIGADAFAEIRSWHRWDALAHMVTFAVVSRPGSKYEVPDGARVIPVTGVDLPISSSEIRRKLTEGVEKVDLPDGVLEYIRTHNLYTN